MTHKFTASLDDLDYRAVQKALATRQNQRLNGECILPDTESDLAGTLLGEICRDWLEHRGLWPTPTAEDVARDILDSEEE